MDEKLISHNREYIKNLFKNVLGFEITESNFKVYKSDEAVFFRHRGRDLYLCFDDWKGQYLLYHLNQAQNSKKATKYHVQRYEFTLGAIFSYLNTMHSAIDLNTKKSRIDELFDKIK